jgi:hypothetical protein
MDRQVAMIKGTSINSFRSGELGYVIGTEYVKPKGLDWRLCYRVQYDDGVIDHIAIQDKEAYEIVHPNSILSDPTVDKVIQELKDRSNKGIAKYGTTLSDNPLSLIEWLQHAKEEAMDNVLYLQRAIDELKANGKD